MGLIFKNFSTLIKILKVRNYIRSKLFLFNKNPKNNKYFKLDIVYAKQIYYIYILYYMCNRKYRDEN